MEVGLRRKVTKPTSVVAGSVWESRMKSDEVKGGFKVFDGELEKIDNDYDLECNDEKKGTTRTSGGDDSVGEVQVDKKVKNLSPKQNGVGTGGRRKTWNSENFDGSPVQIAKKISEMGKNLDENCKVLSVYADGIKKSPVQTKKARSSLHQKLSDESIDAPEKISFQLRKGKSEFMKAPKSPPVEIGDQKNLELRKSKSESVKVPDESLDENGKSCNGVFKGNKSLHDSAEINEKSIVGRYEQNCEQFGVCEEKAITGNVVQVKSPPQIAVSDESDGVVVEADTDKEFKEIDVRIEKKGVVVKEEISSLVSKQKPKKMSLETKRFQQSNQRTATTPSIVKKQNPLESHGRIHPSPSKSNPISDIGQSIPRSHAKLHSFVDLVMWRDVSKSALVFGIGTFFIISSSYTKDLNISFISVISYLGLVYLAAIFLFRSFISRGTEMNDSSMDYVFGEDEAIWLVKLSLPYVNELLLNLRALFTGDPASTMKMALMLFVLARCGTSITIWKLAKLGIFLIQRFREAWESCSHKKAIAFAIFTLVWKSSSSVARVWAAFMLFVAFRYHHQQSMTVVSRRM